MKHELERLISKFVDCKFTDTEHLYGILALIEKMLIKYFNTDIHIYKAFVTNDSLEIKFVTEIKGPLKIAINGHLGLSYNDLSRIICPCIVYSFGQRIIIDKNKNSGTYFELIFTYNKAEYKVFDEWEVDSYGEWDSYREIGNEVFLPLTVEWDLL